MLKILPIQDKSEQKRICELFSVPYREDMLAYSAMMDGVLCGLSQFKMTERGGSLFSLACLPDVKESFEILFTLGRASLNFIDLCGVTDAYFDGDEKDDFLLREIGFTPNEQGVYYMNLDGFFTSSPCKHCAKENK